MMRAQSLIRPRICRLANDFINHYPVLVVHLSIHFWPRFEVIERYGLTQGFLPANINIAGLQTWGGGAELIEVEGTEVGIRNGSEGNGRDPQTGISIAILK